MKILATILPEDVKPHPFQVRCLVVTCWLAMPQGQPNADIAQGYAEAHARREQHAVVVEARD